MVNNEVRKDISRLKKRLESKSKEKDYNGAVITAVDLGNVYNLEGEHEKARKYYEEAKRYASAVRLPTPHGLHHQFRAHRFSLEQLREYGTQSEIKHGVKEFLQYADELDDLSKKQIAYHVVAQTYLDNLNEMPDHLQQAKKYATESLNIILKHRKEVDQILSQAPKDKGDDTEIDDCKRREVGIYQLLVNIFEAEGNIKEAEKYCDKALKYDRFHRDHAFHHLMLETKRRFVDRDKRFHISSKMLEVANHIKTTHSSSLLDTYLYIAEDSLIQKDILEAENNFWKVYSSKNVQKSGNVENAKEKLIILYKLRKRLKEIEKLRRSTPPDFMKISQIYEKCGDEMTAIDALELAVDYYSEMKSAAANMPGDPEYGNLEIAHKAMISLAESLRDMKKFAEALWYYEKISIIEFRLGRSDGDMAENRNQIASIMSYCDSYSFEQHRDAFEKVKMPKSDKRYIQCLDNYISFLEDKKDTEDVEHYLTPLIDERSRLKNTQINSDSHDDDDDGFSSQKYIDEWDGLSDDRIIANIENVWKYRAMIETKKNNCGKLNSVGENDLHIAAKSDLKEVKFLIEKCDYQKLIDSKDNGGWTPLSEAVVHQQDDIVEYLIQRGANVNSISRAELISSDNEICTASGQTPLMEASTNGSYKIICMLVKNGANPCIQNTMGWTARDYLDAYIKANGNSMDREELEKFGFISNWMKDKEARAGILNAQRQLDLPAECPKKEVPKLKMLPREKEGLNMFKEALESLGRKPRAKQLKEYHLANNEMLQDPHFIVRDSDDEDEGNENADISDIEMEADDFAFRRTSGFRLASTPKNLQRVQVDVNMSSEESESDSIIHAKPRKKRKNEALKRRSSNKSLNSSSSKKTKRSTSISKSSDISVFESLTLSQSTSNRLNIEAKELDLSFSEASANVASNLNIHSHLIKLNLKGSDFDDMINDVVKAICSCHKLIELDLSQIEQIESIHVNKILNSCLKLKKLDLYGTSVKVLDLKNNFVLEQLNIAKTPFEFSEGFFEQINSLRTLSFLDVSHTRIDLIEFISKLDENRSKLRIKACNILSHIDSDQLATRLSKFDGNENISFQLSRTVKEALLCFNSSLLRLLV